MTIDNAYHFICVAYLILFTIPLTLIVGHALLTFLAFWFRLLPGCRARTTPLNVKPFDDADWITHPSSEGGK